MNHVTEYEVGSLVHAPKPHVRVSFGSGVPKIVGIAVFEGASGSDGMETGSDDAQPMSPS